ncbi:hypothetical protein BJ322DRAFT_1103637 [Thelephora terrestris]|uniref:CUE domain-containing protein n=1 Tax=Thelephora terrestris TaxID=56493 RepID=A0A9P6LDL1_9AGAM|nr:hypothetical protein BJ322DRAFT_1103637 [Thelephora terrestris]
MAQAEWNAPAQVMTDSPPASDPTPIEPSDTEAVEEVSTNPQVAALQAIFSDFDPIVLQSVLDSVNGNQDRAIDKLLGMSDPEYNEQHSANADQTELDEAFARNLIIQEQEEADRRRQQRQRHAPQEPVPDQQRVDATGQNSSGTAGPNMQEVTETLNKLAESGKRTFSSLFTKVKAKIQELDQPRPDSGSPSTANGGGTFSATPSHQDRHTMMTQAHYQPTDTQPVRGYDMSYQSSPTPVADQPWRTSSNKPDQRPSSPEITLGSNHSYQQTSNIDPAKLGILPKRPVTLDGSSSPQLRSAEELEYAENPFEDERHK